jgi:hypothetical protein
MTSSTSTFLKLERLNRSIWGNTKIKAQMEEKEKERLYILL